MVPARRLRPEIEGVGVEFGALFAQLIPLSDSAPEPSRGAPPEAPRHRESREARGGESSQDHRSARAETEAAPRDDAEARATTEREERAARVSRPERALDAPVDVDKAKLKGPAAGAVPSAELAESAPKTPEGSTAGPGAAALPVEAKVADSAPHPTLSRGPAASALPVAKEGPSPDGQVVELARAIEALREGAEADGKLAASAEGPAASPRAADARPLGPTAAPAAATDPARDAQTPAKLELADALAAEDELVEEEARRLEQLERQRALDDARVRSQVVRGGGLAAPEATKMGAPGGQTGDGGQQLPGRGAALAQLAPAKSAPQATPDAQASFQVKLDTARASEEAKPAQRSRQIVQEAVERVRELSKTRQLAQGKLNLTIRLDESTEVKLRIRPRGDGTHELALLVADPRLRNDLRRSLPEIRDVATELPIDVADVLVDTLEEEEPSTLVEHLFAGLEPMKDGVSA